MSSTKEQKIIKSGGHCYDGCGWFECSFWKHGEGEPSRCMLFGGKDGVRKPASESLNICNKVYGITYTGLA